jgi:hypothetical protein
VQDLFRKSAGQRKTTKHHFKVQDSVERPLANANLDSGKGASCLTTGASSCCHSGCGDQLKKEVFDGLSKEGPTLGANLFPPGLLVSEI